MQHFPAAGEIVLFDRSWYNRAGVEKVMGFCSNDEYERFLRNAPVFERMIVESGVKLIKYWLEVSMEEQERRFKERINDPRKTWKLSPMDVESYRRWYEYSRARDDMLQATDTDFAPWHVVRSENKRHARLNCISHLLGQFPYEAPPDQGVKLGKRDHRGKYDDLKPMEFRRFIEEKF
jgi:polyphosphate kinase 2 (PPK2 family)